MIEKRRVTVEVPVMGWVPARLLALPQWYVEADADTKQRYYDGIAGHRDPVTGETTCTPETCGPNTRRRHWKRSAVGREIATFEVSIDVQAIAERMAVRAVRSKSGKASAEHGAIWLKHL